MRPLASTGQRSPFGDATGFKPRGLWISAEGDDDWKSWCISERFRLSNLRHTHEVHLKPQANVLLISTLAALDDFNANYGADTDSQEYKEYAAAIRAKYGHALPMSERWFGIDWRKVAAEYKGIVIAPYQWQRRLDDKMFWYYSWDCASGCIWDVSAIAELRLTNERAVTQMQITREIHSRMTKRRRKKLWASFETRYPKTSVPSVPLVTG